MKRLALWVLAAATGSFAAGVNVGLAVPEVAAAVKQPPAPDADQAYVEKLASDYSLTAAQRRSLRLVVQRQRDEEIAIFRGVDPSQLPEKLQRELMQARGRGEQRLRALLDADQLARYDLDSRPRQNR